MTTQPAHAPPPAPDPALPRGLPADCEEAVDRITRLLQHLGYDLSEGGLCRRERIVPTPASSRSRRFRKGSAHV